MMPTIRRLLEERRLLKSELGPEAVDRELEGASHDLGRARSTLGELDFKWATVEGYYSMFHAARALCIASWRRFFHHFSY